MTEPLFVVFCFLLCFETLASWPHCIDYNTTSARLSTLGATPAVQVSGGKIPPSSNKEMGHCRSSVTSAHHLPPSGSPQTARLLASPGKGDPSPDARRKRTGDVTLLKTTSSQKEEEAHPRFLLWTKNHHLSPPRPASCRRETMLSPTIMVRCRCGLVGSCRFGSTLPDSGSPKCGQMTCTATAGLPRKTLNRHPWQKMTAQRCQFPFGQSGPTAQSFGLLIVVVCVCVLLLHVTSNISDAGRCGACCRHAKVV